MSQNSNASHSSGSLLIVDDEEPSRQILVRILEGDGYQCVVAGDVAEACQQLSENDFDVVLTDMEMPGESGADLLQLVGRQYRDTATIVITGKGDAKVGKRVVELGAHAYLTKPWNGDDLLATVLTALRRQTDDSRIEQEQQVLREMVKSRQTQLWEYTLELERVEGQLQNSHLEMIHRLARAAEFRDDDTGRHVARVSKYARLIAEVAGEGKERSDTIGAASVLHDIGKISIPDAILRKPRALSDDERTIMQQHCTAGHEMLQGSGCELLQVAASIAMTHHEHWDGGGYPRGLSGDAIPVEGRIVAIADVFDALTSDRVYRRAIALMQALEIMKQGRGTHFDPVLLDVFFSSLDLVTAIATGEGE